MDQGACQRPTHPAGTRLQLCEIQTWSYDELKLVCDTAHQLGIPVVGHCRNASSTRDAALAGFDMILHATYMDDAALQAVIDHKVPLVPTFTFQANLADYGEAIGSEQRLRDMFRAEITDSTDALRQAYDAGVPLLTGSESGFSLTPYGDWHYRELEVFVEYLGLSPLEAIRCATSEGAVALRDQNWAVWRRAIWRMCWSFRGPLEDIRVLDKTVSSTLSRTASLWIWRLTFQPSGTCPAGGWANFPARY